MYLVGSCGLLSLAACGGGWQEAREPWRGQAELACLKAGGVRQSVLITQAPPINGPGVCGADYPFKVAALGTSTALSFAGLPPPAARAADLPFAERAYPAAQPSAGATPRAPMSIRPPSIEPDEAEDAHDAPPDDYSASAPAAPTPRLGPQRLDAGPSGPIAFAPTATLACPIISALDGWIAGSVQPAAAKWFGVPVAEIKQISAYSCRGMNGQRGARISEHAFGNALDIAAFVLADGRKITVKDGWRGAPEEQGFLRDVQGAACGQFSTVLAPGSNRFHYDHIHVDLARHRGGRAYCNPGAVSGDIVAARARGEILTGAVGRRSGLGFASAPAQDAPQENLPRAIPGAD